jgi:hypothetical protein
LPLAVFGAVHHPTLDFRGRAHGIHNTREFLHQQAYGLAPRYGLAADIPMEYDGSKFQIAAPEDLVAWISQWTQ